GADPQADGFAPLGRVGEVGEGGVHVTRRGRARECLVPLSPCGRGVRDEGERLLTPGSLDPSPPVPLPQGERGERTTGYFFSFSCGFGCAPSDAGDGVSAEVVTPPVGGFTCGATTPPAGEG